VLLARRRGGETAVRAVRDAVRHARSTRVGRQRGSVRAVPAVGLLHGLSLPAGGRSGGDLRPDAHAPLAARPARMTGPAPIDLRRDTVTRPSPAMRRAMAEAEVGDDVLDGDPTTRRLEQRVAELLGQEAALFFPSGTQANQTGIALLTRPGTELVLDANAHLVYYVLPGVSSNYGLQTRRVVLGFRGAGPPARVGDPEAVGGRDAAVRHSRGGRAVRPRLQPEPPRRGPREREAPRGPPVRLSRGPTGSPRIQHRHAGSPA